MPIKYEKDLFKIVHTDDINERFNLSCNLLNDIECRKIYRENRLDEGVDRYTKIGKRNVRIKNLEYVKFNLSHTCNMHYYVENPNPEGVFRQILEYKDLNEVTMTTEVEITKDTPLKYICFFLIFTRELEGRQKIYSVLSQVRCLKNGGYKPFYSDKTPILCF